MTTPKTAPKAPIEPIPAEVFLDEIPFTEDDLELALAQMAETGSRPLDLLALDSSEVEQGDHLTPEAAAHAAAVARVAGYQIVDEDHAEWAGSIYTRHAHRVAAAERRYRERVDRLARQFDEETRASARSIEFLGEALERFALSRRADDPKRNKTTTLTSLKVATTTRNAGGKVTVADAEALLGWAERTLDPKTYETVVEHTPKLVAAGIKATTRIVSVGDVVRDEDTEDLVEIVLVDQAGEIHRATGEALAPYVSDDGHLLTEYVVGPDWLPVAGADIEPESVSAKITLLG